MADSARGGGGDCYLLIPPKLQGIRELPSEVSLRINDRLYYIEQWCSQDVFFTEALTEFQHLCQLHDSTNLGGLNGSYPGPLRRVIRLQQLADYNMLLKEGYTPTPY